MEKMIFDQSPSGTLDHIPQISRSNKSINSYSSFSSSYSSSSSSSSYSPYSSGNSLSHLLYNNNNNYNSNAWALCQNNINPLVPIMSPISLYSSLPLPQPNKQQPPLLPLPLHKTSSFPTTPSNQRKSNGPNYSAPKRKPRATTKREPRTESKNVKIKIPLLEKKISSSPSDEENNNNTDEEILITGKVKEAGNVLDCYSISPPPSSLPLPGIALLKPKMKRTTATACVSEAVLEEAKLSSSAVDNGNATDNLRRMLRL